MGLEKFVQGGFMMIKSTVRQYRCGLNDHQIRELEKEIKERRIRTVSDLFLSYCELVPDDFELGDDEDFDTTNHLLMLEIHHMNIGDSIWSSSFSSN